MTDDSISPTSRPVSVTVAALLICGVTLASLLYRSAEFLSRYTAYVVVTTGAPLIVTWFFWRGKNWARWLVWGTSAMALILLGEGYQTAGPAQRAYLAAQGLLGLWLLYWLNTPAVRSYFINRKKQSVE